MQRGVIIGLVVHAARCNNRPRYASFHHGNEPYVCYVLLFIFYYFVVYFVYYFVV